MAVLPSDINLHLASSSGPGLSSAQPDPNASLGGFVSSTQTVDNSLHNLFDVITGDENAASTVDYRCVFVRNSNPSGTFFDAKVWILEQVPGGAVASIGVDPIAASAGDSSSAQAAVIATESDLPAGVTFSSPSDKATALSIGDLAAGQVRAVWVKRAATNSAAQDLDGVTLRIEGDTGE